MPHFKIQKNGKKEYRIMKKGFAQMHWEELRSVDGKIKFDSQKKARKAIERVKSHDKSNWKDV